MDGANADSDHSMTWEDFFGSTTDLTPTLIGIYDSLLEPEKSLRPESNPVETAKDARNDPPVPKITENMTEETENNLETSRAKDPAKIAGGVKLPLATLNKSSLYSVRSISSETESDKVNDNATVNAVVREKIQRTFREKSEGRPFENLSPNVKRMISSAAETSTLKFQKKTVSTVRSSGRHRSNIPLVGATSKISQSGVEILPSVEIYDQPCSMKAKNSKIETESSKPIKPEFKLGSQTYDVPMNNRPAIYDVPTTNKNTFESLSLPYIDSSIELSITCNDREFDIKLSPKDSPKKESNQQDVNIKESPVKTAKVNGTNSLHRKDFKNDSASKNLSKIPFPETVGSTGNLKSCAIPENEVVRLNPPSVEVSRPLSMSSIASSSSTSSSGVQNKGVNSAYLASIESLDDQSDDLTSANGSNNYVNNAGIRTAGVLEERSSESPQQQASDETSGLSQLERVCAEIVQTENVYVEDLRQVVEGYLHIWRDESTFSSEELSELFNNIEDIYLFNRSLCEELNTCRLDATCIARCFVNNTSGFSVYTSYCTGYPRTMERLAALASNSHSAREFRERQLALGHPLPLASYLLKPVQRILKYHLLLQNVVKQCASSETQYALLKMTGIAQHIDDMKRRHEHAVRVQEIQSLLYGWNGPDLTTYGELCAEGTFRVFGAKAMRHAFLFDKMLLVTKNREDGILAYKSHIMCNNMMLVESIAGAPLSFHVIPWDAPRSQLTLQARSPRHKREWTLLLKRVILENYNAVIPSHARQLVMELGQNKTDDDILAEKSHNLITQASMRKQLSAPEYLEKRKLERERRKSFENGIRDRLKKTNRKYTLPTSRADTQDCDCAQISAEKGVDYTCDSCYIDLCSDCESELNKDKQKDDKCSCRNDNNEIAGEKCPDCDRTLHYIDSGSAEHLERKQSGCKCSDFKSSQESFSKEFSGSLNKNRGYHSSDNIFGYTESKNKDKEDMGETNISMTNVRNVQKTCLKCAKIKENIVVNDSVNSLNIRKSRCSSNDGHKTDTLRSKSKDDPHRSKLSKIGTWRRKSEPGLQQSNMVLKKSQDSDGERNDGKGNEKIEFECRNCGSNKISRKVKIHDSTILSDPEIDSKKHGTSSKPHLEIQRYNTKNVPKKITKLKKNRTKGLRLGSDTTAKFYADLSTDVSTENILHISESNDSLNVEKPSDNIQKTSLSEQISKDEDIDEETYKKLLEKTDSFKKNELEKVKFLNKQKVITEGTEIDEKVEEAQVEEETEQPLEQIISQLLMQNREFQKLLKKQQLRNSAQRRHQRLLKSHSNPEQVIIAKNMDTNKLKSKYGRQNSENLEMSKEEDEDIKSQDEIDKAVNVDADDHIYETLRVDTKVEKNKVIQSPSQITRPSRLPSPPKPTLPARRSKKAVGPDSDYVYLSFDKLNTQDNSGIYDVPTKSPEKVETKRKSTDYYVTMENQGPPKGHTDENFYDSLLEVCRRKKDPLETVTDDYLPMSGDLKNPNTPEIWLSRQKEHFNVSTDRKSGSLPRSFQVITNDQDENNLSTFKCKPNSNSKTYLNREGKVMSIDRPFTIASDQSEISYDDVENFMSEGDILKFNKRTESNDSDIQDISKSTLELEEEIDRCYKTNFEANLDKNKNENLLTVSQQNIDSSMNNSCEVLPTEIIEDKSNITEVVHPEHKIYKPTSNVLSLKNVLSRFRNRTPAKNLEDVDLVNANDESSPDSNTSDLKSPTNEKRSALNPRSYSKNLLQRFRSIIGDDPSNENQNRTESHKSTKAMEDSKNYIMKNEIKVVITCTDKSPTTSSIVFTTINDALSKSVCDRTTLSESQNEKSHLESLSQSCDNVTYKPEKVRPSYEKSVSLVTNISSSVSSKSNTSSYQNLKKLPIYMQGSKNLGARIAQADYVDPTTLVSEKSVLKNVNVLINKNAVRPDSLFSNSSFVTSSSEGTSQDSKNTANSKEKSDRGQMDADESYYEKSFEKIENVTDEDVFRDSAVYSDQEEGDEPKTDTIARNKTNKTTTKIERVKSNSFKSQKVTVTSTVNEKSSVQSRLTVTTHTIQHNIAKYSKTNDKSQDQQNVDKITKTKIAPPVPAKPKITNISSTHGIQGKSFFHRNHQVKSQEEKSSEVITTIKNNIVNTKQSIVRSESTPAEQKDDENKNNLNTDVKEQEVKTDVNPTEHADEYKALKQPSNIHIKRLSFERASLDSATRKAKPNVEKRSSIEPPKVTSKSVLERRMEIEQLSKSTIKPTGTKSTTQIPKPTSITTKVATFERSVSENKRETANLINTNDKDRNTNDPNTDIADDLRGSWVKQVVNKFQ